ncbi:MAG: hypothetical protein ABIP35_16665 [Ginsengibacter sp.]
MWIWIVSLILLIACIILAYWIMVSSYDSFPADKKFFFGFMKRPPSDTYQHEETLRALRSKIKSIEESESYREIQVSKLQQRLQALEYSNEKNPIVIATVTTPSKEEENWKELYYEENEIKEKLENELDEVRQLLTDAEDRMLQNEGSEIDLSSLQSEYDTRVEEIRSMQLEMDNLQLRLEAASARERELENSLRNEIALKNKFAHLESVNTQLKCENENMRAHLKEMNKREEELEKKLAHARELESKVSIYEEEKYKMIAEMQSMVNQNKMFFTEE